MGYGYGYGYSGWAPYVPVAERRRRAMKKMAALRKKGIDVQPVAIEGRQIAKSFWGEAWCNHLESFSDFENRLPRGRTYVRNGSVCHLAIAKGAIEAKVAGSELYTVKINIKTLPGKKWQAIKGRCSGRIGSLLELLQGKLSDHIMEVVTDRQNGLFPLPKEISLKCSCPDWAVMCKHVAAVLYGVGARLDTKPELLFTLRGVNHEDLIQADAEKAVAKATARGKSKRLAVSEIGEVFGIELDSADANSSVDDVNVKETRSQANRATKAKAARTPRKRSANLVAKATPTTSQKIVKKAVARKARTRAA
jgi:uncharacterized Zn finger protein